jgi:hypothetical protein
MITLPDANEMSACPHDHMILRSADKPVPMDCEAEESYEDDLV